MQHLTWLLKSMFIDMRKMPMVYYWVEKSRQPNSLDPILQKMCTHVGMWHVTMTVFPDAPQHAAVLILRDWSWLRNSSLCFWIVSEFIVTRVSWTYKKSNIYFLHLLKPALLSIVIKLCLIRIFWSFLHYVSLLAKLRHNAIIKIWKMISPKNLKD